MTSGGTTEPLARSVLISETTRVISSDSSNGSDDSDDSNGRRAGRAETVAMPATAGMAETAGRADAAERAGQQGGQRLQGGQRCCVSAKKKIRVTNLPQCPHVHGTDWYVGYYNPHTYSTMRIKTSFLSLHFL